LLLFCFARKRGSGKNPLAREIMPSAAVAGVGSGPFWPGCSLGGVSWLLCLLWLRSSGRLRPVVRWSGFRWCRLPAVLLARLWSLSSLAGCRRGRLRLGRRGAWGFRCLCVGRGRGLGAFRAGWRPLFRVWRRSLSLFGRAVRWGRLLLWCVVRWGLCLLLLWLLRLLLLLLCGGGGGLRSGRFGFVGALSAGGVPFFCGSANGIPQGRKAKATTLCITAQTSDAATWQKRLLCVGRGNPDAKAVAALPHGRSACHSAGRNASRRVCHRCLIPTLQSPSIAP
jgi:hypothetical protein